MTRFIKGKELSRRFFLEAAKPILDIQFPDLDYSAGLLGFGSDVLGYDDEVSTDHMWGPRFYLFIKDCDLYRTEMMMDAFSKRLPAKFLGYHVSFSKPDPDGIRTSGEAGSVSPLIYIGTAENYLEAYLGTGNFDDLSSADWLSFSENKLLSLRKADFYIDSLDVKSLLSKLAFYPDTVKRYLLASSWFLIAEEQAFVKRQIMTGDKIGSALTASRIAERLMRLCFLYCDAYAPYSKWFGRGFMELPVSGSIKSAISGILLGTGDREEAVAHGQLLLARLHNEKAVIPTVDAQIGKYFNRDIKVIYADKIAEAIRETLKGTDLYAAPLIGSFSQIPNMTCFYDNPVYGTKIKGLYL